MFSSVSSSHVREEGVGGSGAVGGRGRERPWKWFHKLIVSDDVAPQWSAALLWLTTKGRPSKTSTPLFLKSKKEENSLKMPEKSSDRKLFPVCSGKPDGDSCFWIQVIRLFCPYLNGELSALGGKKIGLIYHSPLFYNFKINKLD